MHTRTFLALTLLGATSAAGFQAIQQSAGIDRTFSERFSRMTDAEAAAYIESAFEHGFPGESGEGVALLIRTRGAVVLPVLERKIEETLRAPNPADLFVDKTVNPQRAVSTAAASMQDSCDENALKELAKLVAIDEQRFGWLIGQTLDCGAGRNFFPVAYAAFNFGNAALNKKMAEWVERQFADKTEFRQGQLKRWWAEAMAERNKNVPPEVEWVNDPIAKRMKRELAASLHDEVLRMEMDMSPPHGKK